VPQTLEDEMGTLDVEDETLKELIVTVQSMR
jgi:hypothetical protein